MAMYAKRIGFLRKKEGLTLEQFHAHWLGVHAELCKKLPGLRRYATNLIDRAKYPNAGWTTTQPLPAAKGRFCSPTPKTLPPICTE